MVKAQILLPTARRDLYLESGTAPQRLAMLRVTETRCYGRSSGRCAGTPRRRCGRSLHGRPLMGVISTRPAGDWCDLTTSNRRGAQRESPCSRPGRQLRSMGSRLNTIS